MLHSYQLHPVSKKPLSMILKPPPSLVFWAHFLDTVLPSRMASILIQGTILQGQIVALDWSISTTRTFFAKVGGIRLMVWKDKLLSFVAHTIHGTGIFTYMNGLFLW